MNTSSSNMNFSDVNLKYHEEPVLNSDFDKIKCIHTKVQINKKTQTNTKSTPNNENEHTEVNFGNGYGLYVTFD